MEGLSIQQAADLLDVSRAYVVQLVEAGEIPLRTSGKRRRLRLSDALDYRERAQAQSELAFRELVAQAQAPAANGLEEIVVTATMIERTLDRTPAAVSDIGEDDIQLARQQLALDEALGRVPGLFMQNRYNFAQDLRVSIRGFGARAQFGIRGIKVLVDGIP